METTQQAEEPESALDQLDSEHVGDLINEIVLTPQGYDEPLALRDAMADIMSGHYKLNAYRDGALLLCDALDDEISRAESEGRSELLELLQEIRSSASRLAERIEAPEDEETDE
jgi:hypothetical protein